MSSSRKSGGKKLSSQGARAREIRRTPRSSLSLPRELIRELSRSAATWPGAKFLSPGPRGGRPPILDSYVRHLLQRAKASETPFGRRVAPAIGRLRRLDEYDQPVLYPYQDDRVPRSEWRTVEKTGRSAKFTEQLRPITTIRGTLKEAFPDDSDARLQLRTVRCISEGFLYPFEPITKKPWRLELTPELVPKLVYNACDATLGGGPASALSHG